MTRLTYGQKAAIAERVFGPAENVSQKLLNAVLVSCALHDPDYPHVTPKQAEVTKHVTRYWQLERHAELSRRPAPAAPRFRIDRGDYDEPEEAGP